MTLTRRAVLAAPLLLAVRSSAAPADAYAALLAEEHAAIHLYGIVGPRLPEALRPVARAAYDDHRRHRDALLDAIRAAGGTPAPARLTYAVPGSVASARGARDVALTIEDSLALRWHAAVRDMPLALRRTAAAALGDEAAHLAELRLRSGMPTASALPAFPGR